MDLSFKRIRTGTKESKVYDVLTFPEFNKLIADVHNDHEKFMLKVLWETGCRNDTCL